MNPDRPGAILALRRAVRLWHIAVVVAVVAGLEMLTGLPGFWLVVYPITLALIGGIAFAIYNREGGTVLKRTDTHHGNDMHGHY